MIYQDRFNQAETDAINTLIRELYWAGDTVNYLVAFMKLISDINPYLIEILQYLQKYHNSHGKNDILLLDRNVRQRHFCFCVSVLPVRTGRQARKKYIFRSGQKTGS